jgi:HTH-type transcriptional regulator, quorum sensing regulator NprR
MPSREAAAGRAIALRVGANIRELRTRRKLTQGQLAAGAFSVSYISAVECGKIRPSLRALSILAGRLGVGPAFLLEGIAAGLAQVGADLGSLATEGEDTHMIEVTLLQAEVLLAQGVFGQALELLARMPPAGMTYGQLYTMHLLRGRIHLETHDYWRAEGSFHSAFAQAEGALERACVERARNLLGLVYFLLGDYALARALHEQCVAALAQAPYTDPVFIMDVYGNLASDLVELGESGQAQELYGRALSPLRGMGWGSLSLAERYMQSSLRYTSSKQWSLARQFAQRSLAVYQMREEQKLLGLTHQCLGKALERQQRLDAAEQEYRHGLTIVEGLDASATALCYTSLAEVELLRLRLPEALSYAARALRSAESARDEQGQGQALFTWALVRAAQLQAAAGKEEEYAEVDGHFERALSLLERARVPEIAARAYDRYASLLQARGEVGRALDALKRALKLRGLEEDR